MVYMYISGVVHALRWPSAFILRNYCEIFIHNLVFVDRRLHYKATFGKRIPCFEKL